MRAEEDAAAAATAAAEEAEAAGESAVEELDPRLGLVYVQFEPGHHQRVQYLGGFPVIGPAAPQTGITLWSSVVVTSVLRYGSELAREHFPAEVILEGRSIAIRHVFEAVEVAGQLDEEGFVAEDASIRAELFWINPNVEIMYSMPQEEGDW